MPKSDRSAGGSGAGKARRQSRQASSAGKTSARSLTPKKTSAGAPAAMGSTGSTGAGKAKVEQTSWSRRRASASSAQGAAARHGVREVATGGQEDRPSETETVGHLTTRRASGKAAREAIEEAHVRARASGEAVAVSFIIDPEAKSLTIRSARVEKTDAGSGETEGPEKSETYERAPDRPKEKATPSVGVARQKPRAFDAGAMDLLERKPDWEEAIPVAPTLAPGQGPEQEPEPKPDPTTGPEAEAARKSALGDALMRGRARGIVRQAELLGAPEMKTSGEIARMVGTSSQRIAHMRKRHELLGIQGPQRSVRFPAWQLSEQGDPLPDLPELFEEIGNDPWAVYRFLLTPHPELGGGTAVEAMKAGKARQVLNLARSIGAGTAT